MVCSSDGKESACNAGDLNLIPGWGRIMATHSSILAWKSPWGRSLDCKESDMTEQLTLYLMAQWFKIHLAIQGTWVQSLVGELRSHIPWSN